MGGAYGFMTNLFIERRDTSVQNFKSVRHTGPEIQPFKVCNFERSLLRHHLANRGNIGLSDYSQGD